MLHVDFIRLQMSSSEKGGWGVLKNIFKVFLFKIFLTHSSEYFEYFSYSVAKCNKFSFSILTSYF